MALLIVISTGVLQIRWNVLSLSFSEKESGMENGLSGKVTSYSGFDCIIIHSGEISICNTLIKVSSQSRNFEFNVFSIIHLNGHNF